MTVCCPLPSEHSFLMILVSICRELKSLFAKKSHCAVTLRQRGKQIINKHTITSRRSHLLPVFLLTHKMRILSFQWSLLTLSVSHSHLNLPASYKPSPITSLPSGEQTWGYLTHCPLSRAPGYSILSKVHGRSRLSVWLLCSSLFP